VRQRAIAAVMVLIVAVAMAGCGSTASGSSSASVPAATGQTQATTTTQAASTSAAEPSSSGPPSFVVNATTQEGDKVNVEGRFGPALPASESDVDQTALSECPSPASDGRAVVARLDLTTTLESSLAGEVQLGTSLIMNHLVDFVMGFSEGPRCESESGDVIADLGSLQPNEPHGFTMWVVLADAITPDTPHPSEQTLGAEHWLMEVPQVSVNGSLAKVTSATGPRVVKCEENPIEGDTYIATTGDTPKKFPPEPGSGCPNA
jgi:hypothetical protein